MGLGVRPKALNRMNPLQSTVQWLSTHTGFPARRLESRAEAMVCASALAAMESDEAGDRFLVQRRNGAQDSALRAHALRRSQVHYKCDNSAKV